MTEVPDAENAGRAATDRRAPAGGLGATSPRKAAAPGVGRPVLRACLEIAGRGPGPDGGAAPPAPPVVR